MAEELRPARERRPGGRTQRVRERILAATVELVARHGVSGVRYEDVADLAGVHRTSVYRNWPVPDKLISEALVHFAQQQVPIEDTGDLRRDLVDFLTRMSASLSTSTGRAILSAFQTAPEDTDVRRIARAYTDDRVGILEQRIQRAVDGGELPPVDAYFVAELLAGPVHLYVTRGVRPFGKAEAELLTDVILAGITATNG